MIDVDNEHGENLGVARLMEIAHRAAGLPLPEMKQAILRGVDAWRHGPAGDDQSLLLVEMK